MVEVVEVERDKEIEPPLSSTYYRSVNAQEHPLFTVYWKQDLFEEAVSGPHETEDFSRDVPDYGELGFPYLTGGGFLLEGQDITAQILDDDLSPKNGTFLLLIISNNDGVQFRFPNNKSVRAFGFDYKPSEAWSMRVGDTEIPFKGGRKGFVGIVFHDQYPHTFVLLSKEDVQGGLYVDNIVWYPSASDDLDIQSK